MTLRWNSLVAFKRADSVMPRVEDHSGWSGNGSREVRARPTVTKQRLSMLAGRDSGIQRVNKG